MKLALSEAVSGQRPLREFHWDMPPLPGRVPSLGVPRASGIAAARLVFLRRYVPTVAAIKVTNPFPVDRATKCVETIHKAYYWPIRILEMLPKVTLFVGMSLALSWAGRETEPHAWAA